MKSIQMHFVCVFTAKGNGESMNSCKGHSLCVCVCKYVYTYVSIRHEIYEYNVCDYL